MGKVGQNPPALRRDVNGRLAGLGRAMTCQWPGDEAVLAAVDGQLRRCVSAVLALVVVRVLFRSLRHGTQIFGCWILRNRNQEVCVHENQLISEEGDEISRTKSSKANKHLFWSPVSGILV